MFSTENLKKGVTTVALVLIALAIHQKFISPMLVKKPTVAAK